MVALLLLVSVAELVFDINFAGNLVAVFLAIVIRIIPLFTIGFALAGLLSNARTAQAAASAMFLSGAAIPREQFPEWLQTLTAFIPLTFPANSLTALWIGRPLYEQTFSFAVLIAAAVVAFVFAKATFRWRD